MTYSIWLEPEHTDAKYIKKIILRLAKKYNAPAFPPHVTLYGKIPSQELAVRALTKCKDSSKLKTHVLNIRSSNYLWKTLYVNVKKNQAMSELNQIIKHAAGHSIRYSFEPHISLIYKSLDHTTKQQIIKELKIKSTYTFDKVSVIKSSKTVSKWKKIASVRLNIR